MKIMKRTNNRLTMLNNIKWLSKEVDWPSRVLLFWIHHILKEPSTQQNFKGRAEMVLVSPELSPAQLHVVYKLRYIFSPLSLSHVVAQLRVVPTLSPMNFIIMSLLSSSRAFPSMPYRAKEIEIINKAFILNQNSFSFLYKNM